MQPPCLHKSARDQNYPSDSDSESENGIYARGGEWIRTREISKSIGQPIQSGLEKRPHNFIFEQINVGFPVPLPRAAPAIYEVPRQ
jgi:hypothetical protein